MAPCLDTSAASMRQASIAMSWVADEKPTRKAKTAIVPRLRVGSASRDQPESEHDRAWHSSIHDRRWPSHAVSNGTCARSTNGAQRNLNEEISVTRLKNPITSSDRPEARSQADSVSKIRKYGRPAEKPSATMTRAGRSVYTPSALRNVRRRGADARSLLI